MRICGNCGARNTDDADFCGNCGTFLEFEDVPAVAEPGATSPAVTTPSVSAPPVTAPAVTAPPVTSQPGTTPSATSGPPATTAAPVPTPPPATSAPPATGAPADTSGPAAVQPGVATQRRYRPKAEAIDDRPRPGDIICPRCNAGNPPTRKFCRRCGASLADLLAARLSWWRRLLLALRGKPLKAGARPPRRRRARSLWPVLMIVVALLLVCGLTPQLRAPVSRAYDAAKNAVLDRFGSAGRVVPKAASASSSAGGTSPGALIDGASNTYWAPRPSAPAVGEWFQLELEQPVRVLELIIIPGIATDEQKFRTQSRPHTLQLVATDPSGRETTKTVTVGDGSGEKHVKVRISDVIRLKLIIIDSYDAKPGRVVAVAEVEVVARNAPNLGPSTKNRAPSVRPTLR